MNMGSTLLIPLKIILVDLILGADNAVMIGLACRELSGKQAQLAMILGIAGAIVTRCLLVGVATSVMSLPFVKAAGAVCLFIIAITLQPGQRTASRSFHSPLRATLMIILADGIMGLDNVIALAAIAQGHLFWLVFGVGLSLPLLAISGRFVVDMLRRYPALIPCGCSVLGWIAAEMAVSDAAWAAWVSTHAPALAWVAPLLGAACVYGAKPSPENAG